MKKAIIAIVFIIAFLFTSRLSFFTPSPLGLFTFSEPLFLFSALLLGPIYGALVGGVGFALSSFLLGYPHYIMAALIVNSITGFIVGWINQTKKFNYPILSAISTLILVASFTVVGATIYSGEAYIGYTKNLFLGEGIMESGGLYAYHLDIPQWFWIIAGAFVGSAAFIVFKKHPKHLWASSALLGGCLTLILGYFLYESLFMPTFFNKKVNAATNLIVNFDHSIISSTIALLTYWAIKFARRNEHHEN
ncbi:MAG: ECF transporter S component [Candidatus Bathyarchaeales archaeon]